MRFPFAAVTIDFPVGWFDVTDSLPEGTPPTLSRGDQGHGALQFTTARHTGGGRPKFDKRLLQELLREFEGAQQLPEVPAISEIDSADFGSFGIYADYLSEGRLVRVWYISDGDNLTFATYTAEVGNEAHDERDEAHQMVSSIQF